MIFSLVLFLFMNKNCKKHKNKTLPVHLHFKASFSALTLYLIVKSHESNTQ